MPRAEPGHAAPLATRSDGVRRWLDGAAAPGRTTLRLAGGCQVLETVFTIVQWAALAWVAQNVLVRRAPPTWPEFGVLLAGGLLAAGAGWSAGRFQAVGRRRIAHGVRGRLVAAVLPSRRHREPEAATAALATVEVTDDIADYHAEALPQRLSAPLSMAVIFLVTAAVQWPAAGILLLSSLLVPLNMRLVGIVAKEGAEKRVADTARLAAVVLDSFRGMRTLRSIGA